MASCRSTACPCIVAPSSPSVILCFSPPYPVFLSCNFNPTFHGAAARLQLAAGLRGRRKIRHADVARSDLSKGYDQPSSSDEAIHTCGPFSLLGRSRIMEGDGDQATLGRLSSQEDWRGFRARLCKQHDSTDGAQKVSHVRNWAHEIATPEEGCVLVATERLDGHPVLRRSVVLLTESPESEGGQGWRGVAMNKRLPYAAGEMDSVDAGVAIGLAECPAFVGGPLLTNSASSFHIVTSLPLYGHRAVLPGLCVGTGDTALLAAWEGIRRKVVLPDQLRVHVGHVHWDARALSIEIAVLEWWRITSCSASFLLEDNVDCMWGTLRSVE